MHMLTKKNVRLISIDASVYAILNYIEMLYRPLYNLSYSLSCRFDFMRLSIIEIRSRKCSVVHVGTLTYKLERVGLYTCLNENKCESELK